MDERRAGHDLPIYSNDSWLWLIYWACCKACLFSQALAVGVDRESCSMQLQVLLVWGANSNVHRMHCPSYKRHGFFAAAVDVFKRGKAKGRTLKFYICVSWYNLF